MAFVPEQLMIPVREEIEGGIESEAKFHFMPTIMTVE